MAAFPRCRSPRGYQRQRKFNRGLPRTIAGHRGQLGAGSQVKRRASALAPRPSSAHSLGTFQCRRRDLKLQMGETEKRGLTDRLAACGRHRGEVLERCWHSQSEEAPLHRLFAGRQPAGRRLLDPGRQLSQARLRRCAWSSPHRTAAGDHAGCRQGTMRRSSSMNCARWSPRDRASTSASATAG